MMAHYVLATIIFLTLAPAQAQATFQPTVWELDNLNDVAGHGVTVLGNPGVIQTPAGKALLFDGEDDGVVVNDNPLAGAGRFTVEVIFRPDPGGGREQRFFHMQESDERRVLIETRLTGTNEWFLDTFIKSDASEKTLQSKTMLHPLGQWYHAALVYDGRQMRHYVNGVLEILGELPNYVPMKGGRSSLGCRLNEVFWFKGAIRKVRITPAPLTPNQFLKEAIPTFEAFRFEQNPIIQPEMLPGRDGENINGPSLIRVRDRGCTRAGASAPAAILDTCRTRLAR